jgi:uncharacterized protein YmfQ (DUF2313 family)
MRSATEYLRLFQSLLPYGKAWNRDEDSTLTEFLHAQSEEFARVDTRSNQLLAERNTLKTNELLADHENDLGLPDECSADDETISQRRTAVHAKFILKGQQSPQYFIDLAADLGRTITITEFSPFISGASGSGDFCGDSLVIFYWLVTIDISESEIIYFSSGSSASGDQLSFIVDVDPLICILNKYKPAHTRVTYDYTGVGFDLGFSSGFDSLNKGIDEFSSGGFDNGFSTGFDLYL